MKFSKTITTYTYDKDFPHSYCVVKKCYFRHIYFYGKLCIRTDDQCEHNSGFEVEKV